MGKFKENFNFITNLSILFILIFGGIGYSVGFHPANEILGGTFLGNYIFNGTADFNKGIKFADGSIQNTSSNNTGVLQIVTYTDSHMINPTSTTFIDLYNFSIDKKDSSSKIIGSLSVASLFEGSEEQSWRVIRNGQTQVTINHKNVGITGWGMFNFPMFFEDTNAPKGINTYTLQLKVVTHGWYNYGTSFGNGTSQFQLMEFK